MQTVILCGGKGTRMGCEDLPKPLFPIGDKPILWHIMRIYAFYGSRDFILCLGYKGGQIRDYFKKVRTWKITFADTGTDTHTGGRIARIRRHIKDDNFFATYGDGLADIRLDKLLDFHKSHKKIATISVVRPNSPFGIVGVHPKTQAVTHFEEKPLLDHWINSGFFVFNKKIFNYIRDTDILEKQSFGRLTAEKNLCAYKHKGFWECMDTYKDNLRLKELWNSGDPPWAVWRKRRKAK
ncbi:MAG: sugar phosphate nucleotidyltransferase [Candidatus Omnitrophica bacterium]|nr:sugar phosphate nucleotidyltransferase [Candidatus Omnitrophota bacterium]MDD5552666.1 sugar phosphate nucleotidyltransferase [Candidatus Omnitrophota bacterium]